MTVITKRLDTLYEDRLDGRITTADYDKYVTKYKAEKEELESKLIEYTNNDKSFVLTAEHLLRLAQNAQTIFQSSQPAQKNKILKALLANCQIDQKRLQLNLLKPFSALVLATKSSNWLRLQVTNSLTGVERYKSDTVCIELDRSNNEPRGGVVMSDSEHLKREFTDEERRRLVDYFSLLIEIDQQEKARYAKLEDSPKVLLWIAKRVHVAKFGNSHYRATFHQ